MRAGRNEIREGVLRARHVVIEFADYSTAVAFYESPEYRHALTLRENISRGDLIIIEGYDGPPPG